MIKISLLVIILFTFGSHEIAAKAWHSNPKKMEIKKNVKKKRFSIKKKDLQIEDHSNYKKLQKKDFELKIFSKRFFA